MSMLVREPTLPAPSALVAWAQVVEIARIGPDRVAEVIELGWVEPVRSGADFLFRMDDVLRMRRLSRLCADIGLSTIAGTIVVDLIERVERLENEITELKRLL